MKAQAELVQVEKYVLWKLACGAHVPPRKDTMKATIRFILGPSMLLVGLGSVACNQNGKPARTAIAENAADAQSVLEENWGNEPEKADEHAEDTEEAIKTVGEKDDSTAGDDQETKQDTKQKQPDATAGVPKNF